MSRRRPPNLTSIKSLALVIPGKSSLERLKVLRAEQFPAPILMISGLGSVAMAVSAIKHGAVDFIEKPLYALDIVARVPARHRDLWAAEGCR
jgi:FixJ family two-component response regulator